MRALTRVKNIVFVILAMATLLFLFFGVRKTMYAFEIETSGAQVQAAG